MGNPNPSSPRFSTENQPAVHGKRGPSDLTILKRILDEVVDVSNPLTHQMGNLTIEEVINFQLVAKAFKGELDAIKDVMDRIYGKALQRVSQEGQVAQVYAPSVVNYIAVYRDKKNAGNNGSTEDPGHPGGGALPGSTEPEGKV